MNNQEKRDVELVVEHDLDLSNPLCKDMEFWTDEQNEYYDKLLEEQKGSNALY